MRKIIAFLDDLSWSNGYKMFVKRSYVLIQTFSNEWNLIVVRPNEQNENKFIVRVRKDKNCDKSFYSLVKGETSPEGVFDTQKDVIDFLCGYLV